MRSLKFQKILKKCFPPRGAAQIHNKNTIYNPVLTAKTEIWFKMSKTNSKKNNAKTRSGIWQKVDIYAWWYSIIFIAKGNIEFTNMWRLYNGIV